MKRKREEAERINAQKEAKKLTEMEVEKEVEIDDSLYSRQRYMLGDRAMKNMGKSTVLIVGMGGLGIEIAKNVALAGVKQLAILDWKEASYLDLSTQYYLSVKDVDQKRNRAEASFPKVSELNPYVQFQLLTQNLEETNDLSVLDPYSLVVAADCSFTLQQKINSHCRNKKIKFIAANVRGLFANLFVDFLDNFTVFDDNGEPVKESFVSSIQNGHPTVIKTTGRHDLDDGDLVELKDIEGIKEICGNVFQVKTMGPEQFSVDFDSTNLALFVQSSGAKAVQHKKEKKQSFKSLSDTFANPSIITGDWEKIDHNFTIHVAFEAVEEFRLTHHHYPKPWDKANAEEIIKILKSKSFTQTINEDIARAVSFTFQGSICPLTAFMGGVAGQEVLKGISGKFSPLDQWMYFDASELLPQNWKDESFDSANYKPIGEKGDAQKICLGKELNENLAKLHLFMVGAGAIGCEMVKNFAMLNIGGNGGKITVTDNDLIEKSNLNRQFLFRTRDIGKPKSESAAKAAKEMNPQLNVVAELDKVGPDTEKKFSDEFFQKLDVAVNALDNIPARIYMDQRCVANQRPLLESGTLGAKGHVQVIVPHATESYGSSRDPPEKGIPFCTLKSFPAIIDHCVIWARDLLFEHHFSNKPAEFSKFLDEPNKAERVSSKDSSMDQYLVIAARMIKHKPQTFEDCVKYARIKFEKYFVVDTAKLLHAFPLDHKNNDGTPFWVPPRRVPKEVSFSSQDKLHYNFIVNFALLWANIWGIRGPSNISPEKIEEICNGLELPKYNANKVKKIETDEKKEKEEQEAVDLDALEKFRSVVLDFLQQETTVKVTPEQFEKDQDENHHIDFITAATNMRARGYGIDEADRLEVKRIAGKIMPAIATTTSAVSGLVALELIKVTLKMELKYYRNTFMNLALPLFAFSEPAPPVKHKIAAGVFTTIWDKWEIKRGVSTLQDLLNHFKNLFGLTVTGVFNGPKMIYLDIMPTHKKRLPQKLRELVDNEPKAKYVDFVIAFEDKEGNRIDDAPVVRYWFRKRPPQKQN